MKSAKSTIDKIDEVSEKIRSVAENRMIGQLGVEHSSTLQMIHDKKLKESLQSDKEEKIV